MAFFDTVAFMD